MRFIHGASVSPLRLRRTHGAYAVARLRKAGAVFTGNPELGKVMGLRAHKMHVLWNGAIECKLLHFDIQESQFVVERTPAEKLLRQAPATLTPGAEMFANRLRKNLKQLGKWARNEGLCCYRLYDADMPEYALAIDLYEGAERWAHVQEYAAPKSIDPDKASERLKEALSAIPGVLGIPTEQIFLKVRQRQKGSAQYERLAERGEFHEVQEDGLKLLVNFTDYLDTGLFLDHRKTRARIGKLAGGKRFLNLFCYTCAATPTRMSSPTRCTGRNITRRTAATYPSPAQGISPMRKLRMRSTTSCRGLSRRCTALDQVTQAPVGTR